MPPPPAAPLSSEQIKVIQNWITEGALDISCSNTLCDSLAEVSFSKDVHPILSTFCVGCHNDRSAAGGYSYTSFAATTSSVTNGSLLGSITGKLGFIQMPYNATPMSSCNIQTIETWISNGAPNN